MGSSGIKIYQLMACGYFAINHGRYTAYSPECYRSMEAARAAMPEFYKLMTTETDKNKTMIMAKQGLRILINPLRLISNKKIKTKENEK